MSDDRWSIKGHDDDIIEAFRDVKAEYNKASDERVTNEEALRRLIEGVEVEVESGIDYEKMREIVREESGGSPTVETDDNAGIDTEELKETIREAIREEMGTNREQTNGGTPETVDYTEIESRMDRLLDEKLPHR